MSVEIVIRNEASADLADAYDWYESQRAGLGGEFLVAIEAALAHVQRYPEIGPRILEELRRVSIRRFPFGLYYVFDQDRIEVIAVMHATRHPARWRRRIADDPPKG